jgi:hypothetical protein
LAGVPNQQGRVCVTTRCHSKCCDLLGCHRRR